MTAPTPPTTASFQRERNPFGKGVADGRNSQLYAQARKGSGRTCLWARQGVGDGTVGDYRADGYKLVDPKEVEVMGRGQYFPQEKDFGVYIEFDKKADRVQTLGGMTLMWAPQELVDEIHAENRKLGESFRRKEQRKINPDADVDFTTEVTTTLEKLGNL
ncbi:hypothetical protein [Deinococcus sp. Leaf326]|uniref:hypothetical protein n=1 Tax=Deinococcus sp. Leaf326 TaxID=1736338 RepID=UPI0006FF8B46|nr:hypothetical protein [Deinococcus sp. Leaf326]KQR22870.1 hypothetical protein ASF71_06805 [Deinococcus sp. Leaf326]